MHKEYIKKIVDKSDPADLEELCELSEEALDHLEECDPKLHKKLEDKMYEIAYGKVISEEMAKKWVKKMEPYGEKWDYEETTDILRKNGLNLNPVNFYVVLNMVYNDYAKSVGDDDTMYIKLARDWLKDEDAKEDKLYNYYKYVVD